MRCDVFMSYTNIKEALDGAVSKFRDNLERQLRKKTGDVELTVFQDTRGIHGGDLWEEVLVTHLQSARLLLVLLSPTWLRSPWCRKEYDVFRQADASASRPRPIVPLMWDNVEARHAKTPEEKRILAELRARQILKWNDLQYEDWASPEPKKAAGKLAEELELKLQEA